MKIIRATSLGMCFGVRDALALARQTAAQQSVTVLGQLVHNQTVLQDLQQHGIRFADSPRDVRTEAILITAHGASQKRIDSALATGRRVLEATCPLVHHAHRELRMLLAAGYHPVIVGKRGHVEVTGLTEDLEVCDIILADEDILQVRERSRFGVVAQTTQPLQRVERLTTLLQRRFPKSEVLLRDTVCRPTKERQQAASEVAENADVVIVIGGANSNNTHELVNTCRRRCRRVHHVQTAADLKGRWFHADDVVGLTAGTSTPDWIVDQVEDALKRIMSDVIGADPVSQINPSAVAQLT